MDMIKYLKGKMQKRKEKSDFGKLYYYKSKYFMAKLIQTFLSKKDILFGFISCLLIVSWN